jgi:hypothetical protein
MNENIDLTKILKDCPKGTKFYSMIDGEVKFVKISNNPKLVYFTSHQSAFSTFSNQGTFSTFENGKLYHDKGECILFPSKEQRDWSKFVPTWETKKDVVKVTLHPFDKVLVRPDCESLWNCAPLWKAEMVTDINNGVIETIDGDTWLCSIPYNKDTAHLLGTTDDCPINYEIEFSKEFKDD